MLPSVFSDKSFLRVVFLALVVRLFFFVAARPWDTEVVENKILRSDATGYNNIALNLAKKSIFSIDGVNLDSFRTPGYPFFLFGVHYLFGNSPWVVILVQILISIASVWLLYKIVLQLVGNQKIAILASLMFSIDLHVIMYTCQLFTETLFTFFLLVSIFLFNNGIEKKATIYLFFCGVAISILMLVRPIAQFFPLVLISMLFFTKKIDLRQKMKYSVVLIIASFVFTLPWMYRNYKQFNHFDISSVKQYTLLYYGCAYTESAKTGKSVDEINAAFSDKVRALGGTTVDSGLILARNFDDSRYYQMVANDYLKNNYFAYLKIHLKNSLLSYLNVGTKGFLYLLGVPETEVGNELLAKGNLFEIIKEIFLKRSKIELALVGFVSLYLLVIYCLAVFGIIKLIQQKQYFNLLLILFCLAYFTLLLGPVGNAARFKVPQVPLYSILAAIGYFELRKRKS